VAIWHPLESAGLNVPSPGEVMHRGIPQPGGAIRDDMVNAGVDWVDEAAVVDDNLISARTPADLGRPGPRPTSARG